MGQLGRFSGLGEAHSCLWLAGSSVVLLILAWLSHVWVLAPGRLGWPSLRQLGSHPCESLILYRLVVMTMEEF